MTSRLRRVVRRLPAAGRLRAIGDHFVRVRIADEIAGEVTALRSQLQELRAEVSRCPERSRAEAERVVAERLGPLHGDLDQLRVGTADLRFDLDRLAPAVAAIEARLERMRREADVLGEAAPQDQVTARDLVEQVRREHGQVRARLGAIAGLEERLRRLETGRGA